MTDFSTPYLTLLKLTKDFHENFNTGNYQQAYEISIDIVDTAQKLEDVARKAWDANID